MDPTDNSEVVMNPEETLEFAPDEEEEEEEEKALYEEIDPDFEDTNGAFKTDNPEGKRWQRRFVHCSKKMSRFRKTVETVLVVHGWKTPAKKEPMTLIILSVKLDCHDKDFRFQSVRLWLAFDEDRRANLSSTEAAPRVVAYAPFVARESWNPSEEEIEKTTTTTGTLGNDKYVKAEIGRTKEVKRASTRTYFDRGSADWILDNDQTCGVNWYCEQNDLQKYGVKPCFHLAVLIKREHTEPDGKPIPFSGLFDMRVEAGFIHDFNERRRRIFRLGKQEDEAIYYDPNMEDQIHGDNGNGEKLRAKVKKEHLGELIGGPDGNWLSGLIDPMGNLSGLELEPLQPKTA